MVSGPQTEYILAEELHVTLDANGEGWINGIGPAQYGEEWDITSTQCLVTGSTAETRLQIFLNGTTRMVEGTYSGNQDNSNTPFHLRSGEKLYYLFTRGDVGADAAIILSGKRVVAGRRAY